MVRMENRIWVLMRLLPRFNGRLVGMGSASLTASFASKADLDDFADFTENDIPVLTQVREYNSDTGRIIIDFVLK